VLKRLAQCRLGSRLGERAAVETQPPPSSTVECSKHTCVRAISAVAASSIRLCTGMQPLPPSHASRYVMPTLMLLCSPVSVRGPCKASAQYQMNARERNRRTASIDRDQCFDHDEPKMRRQGVLAAG